MAFEDDAKQALLGGVEMLDADSNGLIVIVAQRDGTMRRVFMGDGMESYPHLVFSLDMVRGEVIGCAARDMQQLPPWPPEEKAGN